MSLPAADLPAPIAVLVLAWDEATPAVRALVAATQAPAPPVDSILVMVPQAHAPAHLSAEEYLPLPPAAADYATPAPIAEQLTPQPAVSPEDGKLPTPTSATTSLPATTTAPKAPAASLSVVDTAPLASALRASPAQEGPEGTPAALGWAAVRVLRLGSYSLAQLAHRAGLALPAPIWTGAAQPPGAPYLGATPGAATLPSTASPISQIAVALPDPSPGNPTGIAAPSQLPQAAQLIPLPPAATAAPAGTEPPAGAPLYELAEPPPQAALETDLPPSEAEETELAAQRSPDDLRSEEPLSLPSAAQAGWPEALAALRQPATLAEPAQTEPTVGLPPAPGRPAAAGSQPATPQYPAPDLNFQVIQYARFAVPVALAEAEFEVIYAPAWPTWLAAQELRQRTGRPLVLHVSTLAAADDEPVGTATGWMAELQRQTLQRADLILTETPALAARLRHELGLPTGLVLAVATANAAAIAQALHTARPRPVADRS